MKFTTFTLWSLPKRFIDATGDPDPVLDAVIDMSGAVIQ